MQTTVRTYKFVKLTKEATERIAKAERERLCVACLNPLGSSRVIRGCHEACKKATERAIARGDFTEEERVRDGKLLSGHAGGRKPTNPVTIEARGA